MTTHDMRVHTDIRVCIFDAIFDAPRETWAHMPQVHSPRVKILHDSEDGWRGQTAGMAMYTRDSRRERQRAAAAGVGIYSHQAEDLVGAAVA